MNRNRLTLLAGTAPLLPFALLPLQTSAAVPIAALHADDQAATWTFHHEHVLGTSLTLRVQAPNRTLADHAEAAALAEIDRQQHLLSAWLPDSEFARWAQTRFEPVAVSPELFNALDRFESWRTVTGGALDPSAEAAIRLWRSALAEHRTPTPAEIAETVEAMQQPHWQLDHAHHTVTRLTDVPLALASFVKSTISSAAADAALRAGVAGVMLNLGGDIVVRGTLQQTVDIADPRADAENDRPLDRVVLRNGAVATSGSYRRGIQLAAASAGRAPAFSHIVDPRTAQPTGHVLSSTVIAPDAETAGALATAFSVLSAEDSLRLAERFPRADYLLILADGRTLQSAGWAAHQAPGIRPVVYRPAAPAHPALAATGLWNQSFDLSIALDLPRIDDARYRRPYLAVWVEDADHFPVRTLALWTQNPRWLPELKQWYRDDQIRNLTEGTDISRTVSSATRPPGHYTLRWDGKDDQGKLVRAGRYTVVVEASREHGGYQVERQEINFDAQPAQATLASGTELGAVTFDYAKH